MFTDDHRHAAEEKETARVEAFSDGVLAIAITLLVLDLRVPGFESIREGGLLAALTRNWPSFFAYLLGFVTILIMWINHHRLFSAIRRSDDKLLFLNGLLLLTISVVPFPTKLVAEYLQHPEANVAAMVYGVWGFVIALLYNAVWRYASENNRLFSHKTDLQLVSFITRQYAFGPLFYLAAAVISAFSALGGLAVYMALAVVFGLPNRQYRKLLQSGE